MALKLSLNVKRPVQEVVGKKNENIKFAGLVLSDLVYVKDCRSCKVHINGKVAKVTIDGCNDCEILFEGTCVSGMFEVIRCQGLSVTFSSLVPTITVDNSLHCSMVLPPDWGLDEEQGSMAVMTCQSSVVLRAGEEDEFKIKDIMAAVQQSKTCRSRNGWCTTLVEMDDVEMPPVSTEASPRFEAGSQEMLDHLREHGYVVVKGVADHDALEKGKDLFWEWAEGLGTVRRADVESWNNLPVAKQSGIIGNSGIGQSPFMWHMRALPKVRAAFAAIWDTDDLITSFDGANIFRPFHHRPEWRTNGGWYHVDQNSKGGRSGLQAVQGLVTLYDADERSGSLAVIPQTHHHFEALCDRAAIGTHHFVSVPVGDPILKRQAKMVKAKAGDLLLWDSRTVHCNTPAVQPPKEFDPGHPEPIRLVSYICMTPRAKATAEVLQARKKAFVGRQSTNHWPHDCATNDPPSSHPNDLVLTEAQAALL